MLRRSRSSPLVRVCTRMERQIDYVYPTDGFSLSDPEKRGNDVDVDTSRLRVSHLTVLRPLLKRQGFT
jgi:hypothetical protein